MPHAPASPPDSRPGRLFEKDKARAQAAVSSAIKSGSLINPGLCSECGSNRCVEAHHDDYAKPLAVRWLCRSCHKIWHDEHGRGGNSGPVEDTRRCQRCNKGLPRDSRSDRKFCSTKCRRASNREDGRVASVRRLKSGLMSVVVHMHDAGLKPGDQVKVGTD